MTRPRAARTRGEPVSAASETDPRPSGVAGLIVRLAAVCREWWEVRPARDSEDAPALLWSCASRIAVRLSLLAHAEELSLAPSGALRHLADDGCWDALVGCATAFDPGGFGPVDAPWAMPDSAVSGLAHHVLACAGRGGGLCHAGAWYAVSLGHTLDHGRAGLAVVPDPTRGRLGVHHTPALVASQLASRVLRAALECAPLGADCSSFRVVDPTVGGGALLLAWTQVVAEHVMGAGAMPSAARAPTAEQASAVLARVVARLHGVDVDPFATAITRTALWIVAAGRVEPSVLAQNIVAGCALTGADMGGRVATAGSGAVDWSTRFGTVGFDVLLANPPFLDNKRIASALKRAIAGGGYRCAHGLYDFSVPFVERALDLVRPGGVLGVLVPNKLATRDYGERLRREVAARCAIVEIAEVDHGYGLGPGSGFSDASVHTLALVARRAPPDGGHGLAIRSEAGATLLAQSALLAMPRAIWPSAGGVAIIERVLERAGRVETRHLGRDLGRSRYRPCGFAWKGHLGSVRDHPEASALRFVGCASLSPFRVDWDVPFRLGGRRCARAWLARPGGASDEVWADLQRPKLLVREVATDLCAAADLGGDYSHLTGLYGYVDLDPDLPIDYVAALLNSAPVRAFYRALFWNGQLSGGYLDVRASYLALVPILPAGRLARERIVACARTLSHGDDEAVRGELDVRVRALYGLDA